MKLNGILLLFLLLLFACNKDKGIIEEQLVVTKIDRSIPTDYDIVEFDVVNENLCFALGLKEGDIKLFKTLNGGVNWTEITGFTVSIDYNDKVQSIVFFDENNGVIVADNRAHRTYNEGQTWSNVGATSNPPSSSYATSFIFAGKTENNELIIAESQGNSWYPDHIFTSAPASTQYSHIGTIDNNGNRFDYGRYSNGKLFYLVRDFNYWNDVIPMFDYASGNVEQLDVYDYGGLPMDAMFVNDRIIFARQNGKIDFYDQVSEEWNVDWYNFHENHYYSIDFIDHYYVAVANNSISTNFSGIWEEAINPDGNGHKENFLKVKKIDGSNFFVSGAAGIFYKATFQ